jgi:transcriptional regulator GlxA family with amidase domain
MAMRIQLLVLDGVFDTGLAALQDTLETANLLASGERAGAPPFQVLRTGVRRRVRTCRGLAVPVQPPGPAPDWVVVPALGTLTPEPLLAALARPDVRDGCALLRDHAAGGSQVAAACIGTFVLAESGLLDGEASTTTWWLSPLFRQRYPRVHLEASRILVRSGRALTAGAALSHVDLALWLIRQESPTLADLTARHLVLDPRSSQAAYVIPDHLAHADPLVRRFEGWARDRLGSGFSLEAAAADLATSRRTLLRRMRQALGKSPLAYFQELRVERAVHLLRTTDEGLDAIAAQVGYQDGVTLRTLLRRQTGRGIRELRRR